MSGDAGRVLKDLINICEDGIAGYDTVAGEVLDPATRWILVEIGDERRHFAQALANLVIGEGYGTDFDDVGTLRGAVHQAWIDVLSVLDRGDAAMLGECVRGEDAAIDAFGRALDADLPENAVKVVQSQLNRLRVIREQVEKMRDRVDPEAD
jgi:uncharacterized protein (TIGR02284 family)